MRYLNTGTSVIGVVGSDSSSDSGIEACDQDDDICNSTDIDGAKYDDNISTASDGRSKGSKGVTGEPTTKKASINQQHMSPPTTSWSPPPPLSFRSEQQQQQQQHRVTHGPGGKLKMNNTTYFTIKLFVNILLFCRLFCI